MPSRAPLPRAPQSVGRVSAVAAGVFLLAACASHAGRETPADAIPIGREDGVRAYMVPLGRDDDGCRMYQKHVPGRLVAQVIHYQTPDGRFVTDRREAGCMQPDGTSETGD